MKIRTLTCSERRDEPLTELASANMKETLVQMQTLARETITSPSLEGGKEQVGKDLFVLVLFLTLLPRHLLLITAGHQMLG